MSEHSWSTSANQQSGTRLTIAGRLPRKMHGAAPGFIPTLRSRPSRPRVLVARRESNLDPPLIKRRSAVELRAGRKSPHAAGFVLLSMMTDSGNRDERVRSARALNEVDMLTTALSMLRCRARPIVQLHASNNDIENGKCNREKETLRTKKNEIVLATGAAAVAARRARRLHHHPRWATVSLLMGLRPPPDIVPAAHHAFILTGAPTAFQPEWPTVM